MEIAVPGIMSKLLTPVEKLNQKNYCDTILVILAARAIIRW